MEIGNKKYVFVINNTIIKEGKIIFQVSTKDIKYGNLNKLSKIKKGQFKNVRFDIDGKTWPVSMSCTQYYGQPSCGPIDCNVWSSDFGNIFLNPCPNDDGTITTVDFGCGECCYDVAYGNRGCINEGNA